MCCFTERKSHSLFHKVLAGYLVVTVLVVVLSCAVSYYLVRDRMIDANLNDLLARAQSVASTIARPDGRIRVLTVRGLWEVESLTDATMFYVDDEDMTVRQMPIRRLRRKDGEETMPAKPWTGSPPKRSEGEGEMPGEAPLENEEFQDEALTRFELIGSVDEALVRSIMSGNTDTDVRKLQFAEDLVMFAGVPITDLQTGETGGALILSRPLKDATEAAGYIVIRQGMAGLIAILCVTLFAWFMSRRIVQPVIVMSGIAQRMAEGHYGEHCTVHSGDELGRLASTLNTLSERLDKVIGTLNDEKSKLEMILRSIGEGIVAIDRTGAVIHHNGAALNLLGIKDWDDASADPGALEHREQLTDILKEAAARGEQMQTDWTTLDGRTIQAIASPVRDIQGEGIGAVCLVRDISQAQKLEQIRREYIGNVSHELRTPLTGIRGMTEPLLDGLMETEEEKQECYRIIYQETIRLEKLIGDMLDLSRLQSGHLRLELEPIEAEAMLRAAARRIEKRAREADVELRIEAGPELLVMGEEGRILQVLIILLDNALAFTPSGGEVTLSSRAAGEGRVLLIVSDTGPGIDKVDMPYIWERFYKADRSRMGTSGTGLGLTIAKLVVELMQGSIEAESEPGKGATFTVRLNAPEKRTV